MKERILESLKGKAEIIEQIEENDIWAISYKMPSGTCGHVILKGEKPISKGCYKAEKPESLAETIALEKRAGNL